jgi:putative membrane protein
MTDSDATLRSALQWVAGLIILPWISAAALNSALPDSYEALRRAPWAVWQAPPGVVVPLAIVAFLYLRGLRLGRVPPARRAAFAGGLGAIFLALQSPIESLADHSLALHQVEHMLLRTVAPALLVLSQPQGVLLRGMPSWLRRNVVAPLAGSSQAQGILRGLSRPLPATLVFVGVTWFWMIPRWHDVALADPVTHELWHASLLASGLLFFWRVFDTRPEPRGASLFRRLLMIWGAEVGNLLLGFWLTYKSHVIYPIYAEDGLIWHVSALHNELYGGQTMWVVGGMMIGVAGIAVVYRWALGEERARRHLDLSVTVRAAERMEVLRASNRHLAIGILVFVVTILGILAMTVTAYEGQLSQRLSSSHYVSRHLLR